MYFPSIKANSPHSTALAPLYCSSPTMAATAFLLLVLFLSSLRPALSSSFGINYGQVANNLPSPTAVLPLLHSLGVSKVKLYDSDPAVLRAFAGTGVGFTVGLPDRCIPKLAKNHSEAFVWVKYNILPYLPATKISTVTIGNEVLTSNDTSLYPCLLPAMQAVHSALSSLNLDRQIAVTTAHSLAVLATSYPPSSACFKKEICPHVLQILWFLAKTNSPFLINAYPYFAYRDDPHGVSLNYVLHQPNSGVVDQKTGVKYDNMLHAQVDAVNMAIEALVGKKKAERVVVKVSETGWPSKGDGDEAGASVENARRYNENVMRLVEEKKGTPMRTDVALEVYVFALFNENLKPGPASERNYGLFKPDGTPVYKLDAYSGGGNSSTSSGGGGCGGKGGNDGGGGAGGVGALDAPDGSSSSTGFYSISDATKVMGVFRVVQIMVVLWACWGLSL